MEDANTPERVAEEIAGEGTVTAEERAAFEDGAVLVTRAEVKKADYQIRVLKRNVTQALKLAETRKAAMQRQDNRLRECAEEINRLVIENGRLQKDHRKWKDDERLRVQAEVDAARADTVLAEQKAAALEGTTREMARKVERLQAERKATFRKAIKVVETMVLLYMAERTATE